MCNKEGVVINAKTGGKIKPYLSRTGYFVVSLNGNTMSIHRIVATLFVEKTNPRFNTVNHKNEIKTDNRAENLEWCSTLYNITYGHAQKKKKGCFCPISVIAEINGNKYFFPSLKSASNETGVNINSIRRCIAGEQKMTRKGYSFIRISRAAPVYSKKKVKAIKDNVEEIFESVRDAATRIGISRAAIKSVINGKRKTAKGFSFFLLE